MGFSLFGSSGSKSTSSTTNYNQAQTLDLSSNGLGDTKDNLILGAGSSYNIDGLSEDIVKSTFDGFNKGFDSLVGLASSIFKTNENLTAGQIQSNQTAMQSLASVYGEAYGTQKSTAESLKIYAFYGLVGFIAWTILNKKGR